MSAISRAQISIADSDLPQIQSPNEATADLNLESYHISIEEVLSWIRESASAEDLRKLADEIDKRKERDSISEQKLSPVKTVIRKINSLKELRKIEIVLKEQREKLIKPGEKNRQNAISLTIKYIKGTPYIYEQWKGQRDESRKRRKDCKHDKDSTVKTHRIGPVSKGFPPDYDLSIVKVSDSVRKHFPNMFG